MKSEYERIPAHMLYKLNQYVLHGCPLGGFLAAVVAFDLGAIGRADQDNLEAIVDYYYYAVNYMPERCVGSYEKVRAWQEAGGLKGICGDKD